MIEDNRDFADTTSLLLKHHGFQVETAEDGYEGVQKARSFHPDIVLMDIGIPGLNGFQAARAIHESEGRVPIIALSAYDPDQHPNPAGDSDFHDYLVKPVEFDELLSLLQNECVGYAGSPLRSS